MIIKKSSWHYRLNSIFFNSTQKPTTLCGYFWRTVATIGISIILTTALLFFSYVLILDPLVWIFSGLDGEAPLGVAAVIATVITMSVIMSVAFAHSLLDKYVRRTMNKKEHGVFMSYVKAKKAKVCPLITYKD